MNAMVDMNPLVTIVTPYYNSKDLFDAVQSVITQDYPHLQYILIDDGSVYPKREDVCKFLEGKDVKCKVLFLENEENIGTVKTMNRAYSLAEGKYIFNLAADDVFYDSQVISGWVSHFQNTGAMVSTGYRVLYDGNLKNILRLRPIPSDVKLIRSGDTERLFRRLCRKNIILGCVTAYSKVCLDQYGFYDTAYRLIEDYPKVLSLSREGISISFYDRKIVKCRTGGTSSGKSYSQAYRQDSDLIFKKEILTYAKNPVCATYDYLYWIIRQRALNILSKLGKQK